MTAHDPGLSSAYDAPEVSPGFLLWQVTNHWQAMQRAALKPFGLTHVQFVLLASLVWLETNDEPVTQKYLAGHAGIDVMMTSQVARTLETKGLIKRLPHPNDRRAILLTATTEAVVLVNQAVLAVKKVDQQLFGYLGHRQDNFIEALQLLRANFNC